MLAQIGVGVDIPDIGWSAIAPELILFSFGLLVLVLDIAGERRLQAAFLVGGAAAGIGGYVAFETEEVVIPGLIIALAVAQFALTGIWRERPRMLGALLAGIGFASAFAATAWQWSVRGAGGGLLATDTTLAGMVAVDGVALFTRFIVCLAGLATIALGFSYAEDRRIHRPEYYPLLLFAATGMTLLASSADLIMVFIAVEILSLALYVLTAFARSDLVAQEAAIKYFLLGAFSSALLVYGIAITYGLAGSTRIAAVGQAMAAIDAPAGMTLAAMGLLLVGLAFKTALAPFHMWTPDVYQGAPTPITGYMAAATKAAAFAVFLRIFVGALAPLQWTWTPVVWLLAVLTMLGGAILAVVQDDVKRMLGYSAVAHSGYLLIGLIAVSREGVSATLFYLLVYAVMALGAFGVLSLLERRTRKAMSIADLRGIGRRHPALAMLFGLFMLSLAGLPPTAGFWAKLAIFTAGVRAGWTWLVVIAVVSSLIAFFFYVRIIAAMFLDDEPADVAEAPALQPTGGALAGLAATGITVVVIGLPPLLGQLVDLAARAASFGG
jgi:NADH-quinone oxidoreductase subunit N